MADRSLPADLRANGVVIDEGEVDPLDATRGLMEGEPGRARVEADRAGARVTPGLGDGIPEELQQPCLCSWRCLAVADALRGAHDRLEEGGLERMQ